MTFAPSPPPLDDVSRVLCVLAHPDDVDFGAAGTVAQWVDQGLEVSYLLVTRGDAGGFDEAVPREQMPIIREAEQRAAAAALGVKQVDFLDGYADGTVTPTLGLRRDIAAAIRRARPDRVLTNAPLRRWDRLTGPSHPDHLATGEAVTCAVYPDARNPFAFPELLRDHGLAAWTVREIWFAGGPAPDHVVDITDTVDRKIAALRAHESQTSHFDIGERIRPWNGATARAAGLPEGHLAEAFTIVRTT
ncbi:GlcNAc-PI de-N-acetylase [Virgisporangium aliadipatigenens]|uniref:GlcNAc-PI de-N-acetylase n=1 Tax=Virgisporangium aliadipatigenens TaxID=741659 RepID=A0A8J3YIY0_9ACTN|nr:PIG-L deacetylase family protein [Virgisporangium aliadipatigenens]GIJ44766.1 GlcNAc-PI de-N-acetylase [Virgisporangium aliadipatigenens]